jgi:hypothetical protein
VSLKTNREKLVMMSISGKVSPAERGGAFNIDYNGKPSFMPGTGGICYNVLVGDSAFGWAGEHIEPGVSTRAAQKADDSPNPAYNFLACIGNTARLTSGEAKGETGVVTGHHGGSERVMIDFLKDVMDKMTHDDGILIKSCGQGLCLFDYPEVRVCNIDPDLFEKLPLGEENGHLSVGVTHIIPGKLMGSGVGDIKVGTGDYDIMTSDPETVDECSLATMRFGDIVAIMDHDNVYGRSYRKGSVTIGVIIHSDCFIAGHGPGVTTILSSRTR